MIVAETNRLFILQFTLKDAPFFLELVNSPNWIKYIDDRNTKTVKAAEERIQDGHLKSYQSTGFGFYKLLLKAENNKPIGTCGLIKRDTLDDVDIGFAMLPDYEGIGIGYEASKEVIKLAKQQFKLKRLVAIINPDNKKSIKLIEKLGFTFEKLVKPFADDEELLLFAKTL
ncbi:GNAT family N-acetyltransferase [Algibacter amylolyticus]|uniref:GNAT family N-acetyltransferase n=1 Tax=Algibacter amylolyticus TaxID=1608400 RepID=A0A5M7BFG1_9FLAO|nr:GNAT family N-acetyltransferase [Algibacter amylolyticus]KAA5827620.1 GNAT family N-acetyltransferase [Algibacter amylolyticus]MBB5266832.1 RimJ/RimL family protein N-acetyltransferase [Algibacter amylolyticus]TSJ81865.1 GNAT family N-acetyltransferase [Algibacter amylolyticus]